MSDGVDHSPNAEAEVIRTERLDLRPLTREICQAVLTGDRERASALLGVDLGEWPRESELEGAFPGYVVTLAADPSLASWLGRAIVLRERGLVIGSANLKGRPGPDGRVEIGYGLTDAYQGQGYAREAVTALVAYAFTRPGVLEVSAEIDPSNERSMHLVESLGFQPTGIASVQHEGHLVWLLPIHAWARAQARG